MTIKANHINPARDTGAWLSIDSEGNKGGMDVLTSPEFARYVLSAVRHIMRDESCDMVPVPVAAFAWPNVNQWGHNFEIEVQYARRGWRAIFAGRITPDGLRDVQCYMD